MRLGLILKTLLLASAIPLIGGCGGLSATPAFSPLMLLMPGFAQTKPAPPQIIEPMQVASNKDLSKTN